MEDGPKSRLPVDLVGGDCGRSPLITGHPACWCAAMEPPRRFAELPGRLVMLGFGSIGRAVLPLLQRHIGLRPQQVEILKPSTRGLESADAVGVRHTAAAIRRDDYRAWLSPRLAPGDVLLNLSVDVSSHALIRLCQQQGALYVDASTEPWPGTYTDRRLPPAARTNYRLREDVLALRGPDQPTALITLGANPGLVSFLVKRALLDLAGPAAPMPGRRTDWAELARQLGVQVIHIAERDSQASRRRRRPGEFLNTWSVDGFLSEALQPAELGWGTHERHFPADGSHHTEGCRAAIWLNRPGAATRVRSWAPHAGPYLGWLVTHAESISIADALTLGPRGAPYYRPTVHYAYHPCDEAVLSLHERAGRAWDEPQRKHVLDESELEGGMDELGVLLMGPGFGAYWLGSQLDLRLARALCPCNSATTLQVAAPLMAGVAWALNHPREGILEPDDLPHDEMLAMIHPYLGPVVGVRSGWTPLEGRGRLFDEPALDHGDPWQFVNFRVD
jgi:homospermidine synthase